MAGTAVQVLLVTANVGSIFEDPSVMLKIWTEEFLQTVARLDPKFIAIHCQEVGGKNYERSMKHVEYFVRLLMTSEELRLFDKVRVYLDEDFSSAENFTALGNFYFIHETLSDALIWDFAGMNFVPASGKEVHSGNIEAVTTKEKAKFPQDFFPECKWSRKGFLRTRWSLSGTIFDLINIHLFHDASNFIAMEAFPSVYCKNRRRALEHTLERFHNDSHGTAPFFVFGDFNFRTDTQGVVAKLSEGFNQVRIQNSKADQTKMQYQDENSQVILSVGKKEFIHSEHQNIFAGDDGTWLKAFDRELDSFSGSLFEFPIAFPPSYPFEEDENGAKCYMKTRCPAWCDRVILANTATSLVNNLSDHSSVEYGIMGSSTCMGDHKPVYLSLQLLTNTGTVCCCPPAHRAGGMHCLNGLSRYPVLDTLTLPRLASYVHEPYTPESMDTPSPIPSPIPTLGEVRELHKSFNDSVAARLRQQSVNIQGDQGLILQISHSGSDWTHCQSSDRIDNESPLDNHYSDYNANTKQKGFHRHQLELCELDNKPLLQSPQVLVTQFAQVSNDIQGLERYFVKTLETELFNEPLTEKCEHEENEREATEIPPGCLSDYDKTEKTSTSISNRVSSQETLVESVKDMKTKKTFMKSLQSQSASEIKTCAMYKLDAESEIEQDLIEPRMRTSRCFSDASWLQRKNPLRRVQLISGSESMSRLQSHHSSSDEDWFEEVQEANDVSTNEANDVSTNEANDVSTNEANDVSSNEANDVSIIEANDFCANKACSVPIANQVEVKLVDLVSGEAKPLQVMPLNLVGSETDSTTTLLKSVVLVSKEANRLEVKPVDLVSREANHLQVKPIDLVSIEADRLEVQPVDLVSVEANRLEVQPVDLVSKEAKQLEFKLVDHLSTLTNILETVDFSSKVADRSEANPVDLVSRNADEVELKPVQESMKADIPDICALLYEDMSEESSPREPVEVVRLYKNLSESLDQVTSTSDQWSVSPECGDRSTASLMAYFQEQSEALASEASSDFEHIPEEKEEPNKRCVPCCVIL